MRLSQTGLRLLLLCTFPRQNLWDSEQNIFWRKLKYFKTGVMTELDCPNDIKVFIYLIVSSFFSFSVEGCKKKKTIFYQNLE